jgi:hypothetical protein
VSVTAIVLGSVVVNPGTVLAHLGFSVNKPFHDVRPHRRPCSLQEPVT